jgi:superfamily I DNA/RNA helicase
MPQVITTKQFNQFLRDLQKKGKKGKDAMMKTRASQAEAASNGEITLKRTNHGESRLENVEKYDLGDGYRLVVQVVDPANNVRAFLFVGDHDDSDRWLENHRDYKWIKKESDETLDFVQVTVKETRQSIVPTPDLDTPESLLDLPLLRDVDPSDWKLLGISSSAVDYLKGVTANDWEQDPEGVIAKTSKLTTDDFALFTIDILSHAHKREWKELGSRISLRAGEGKIVKGKDAASAMELAANSERFVTWKDLETIPEDTDWSDWMLFLHADQKEFATREYNGPTRLRGVSGSGKTCVMVHRARMLAKKYKEPLLLVTLTESMRKLLELLKSSLCGAEGAYIRTSTMNALAEDAIEALGNRGTRAFTRANDFQKQSILEDALNAIKNQSGFDASPLARIPQNSFGSFIEEEFDFIRMRLLPDSYEKYLEIKRIGRGLPLAAGARALILNGLKVYEDTMQKIHIKDHLGVVQYALQLLESSPSSAKNTFVYRSVLVDEVQDLSQLEMRILAIIPDSTGKSVADISDGLFLVGDGAQTIYKRGFALRQCGISVATRSFVLKKNYRNTKEILQAAYGLIANYEFADVDEDNIQAPTPPDLSSRHGEKPYVVKCATPEEEADFVVQTVLEIIASQRQKDDFEGRESDTEVPIGVIGFTKGDRIRVYDALKNARVNVSELREDISWDLGTVKISTLESAKGHEFHTVFIVGLREGVIPNFNEPESEWKREAARLYVGMTRARDRLFLTYNTYRSSPSIFLAAVQSDCQEVEFKNRKLRAVT